MSTHSSTRCILHIGAPKTGSTLLQKLCFDNRERLAAQGVLYPDVSLRGWGHHDLAFLIAGGYPDWATPQPRPLVELVADLTAAVGRHNGDVLISSENFFLFPAPAALRTVLEESGALDKRRATVVVYVRRQDAAHESWYNQTIKAQGATHDFDACVEQYRSLWDYQLQLDAWSTAFGRDALIVRPYEEGQLLNASLAEDFLQLINVDSRGWRFPTERVNSGLNSDALEFQRIVNTLPLTVQEKRRFHRDLIEMTARLAGTGVFDERPIIDAARRREILARYEAGNRAVAEAFLGRTTLFRELPGDESTPAAGTLTVEKLAAIVGWLLVRRIPEA